MQNKFFCTQSVDISIVHVRKNKMNIVWNWIKVHQKQEEIENALVFIFFFSWYHLGTIDLILVSILCKNQISVGANSHRFSSYFSVWQLKLVRKV